MSVAEPNPDDEMRSMIEALGMETPDVVAATDLSDRQLVLRYQEIHRRLARSGELAQPQGPEGRELHSQHTALFLEMKKRKLS